MPVPHPIKEIATTDITGQLILLGTGTSVGVPAIGCLCKVCQSDDPKDKRLRASAVVGLPDGILLIDTSPDLRTQLLRERIGVAHAVIYTHEHTDHLMGFDDIRLFQFYLGQSVPIYCTQIVEQRLRMAFDYAFSDKPHTHAGAAPDIVMRRIGTDPVEILGATVIPIPMKHGPLFNVLGFRIGNVAYCTDVNYIPPSSLELLQGLDVLILDALRPTPHVTHFSIDEAVEVCQQLNPRQTYFTHCSCSLDYKAVNATLPAGIEVGYDGLRVELKL